MRRPRVRARVEPRDVEREEVPTIRLRGSRPSGLARVAPSPEEELRLGELALAAGRAREATLRASAVLAGEHGSLGLRARILLTRGKLALGERKAAVLSMDEALSVAHQEGASPVQVATLNFWRALALGEAGRPLEALSDLDSLGEALELGAWFEARFRLDGVTGLTSEVTAAPLLRGRALALRCWLLRVMVRERRSVAEPEGLLDHARALSLAPEDGLIRELLSRDPALPKPVPLLRRWRLPPLPSEVRMQWLAGPAQLLLREDAEPTSSEAWSLDRWEAREDRRHEIVRQAWTAPENARGLVAIAKALAVLGPSGEDRRQAGALLVRRARLFELMDRKTEAALDRQAGRELARAYLGPTRWLELRLETLLARLAFWGGDFESSQRWALKGLRRSCRWDCSGPRLHELLELQGQLAAAFGLSTYVLAIDQPKSRRDRYLTSVESELWFAERFLGAWQYERWQGHAERAALLRSPQGAPLPAITPREPEWLDPRQKTRGAIACGRGRGRAHTGPGPCGGASCQPSVRAKLVGLLR